MILIQSKDVEDLIYAFHKPTHSKTPVRIEFRKSKWHGNHKASCGTLIVDNADLGKVDLWDDGSLKKAYKEFAENHLNHKRIFADETDFVSTLKDCGERLGHHEVREESADGYSIERDYYKEDANVRNLLHRPDLFGFMVKVASSVIRCEPSNVPAGIGILLSSWTDEPASVAVRGASATGKTWLFTKLLSMFPKERTIVLIGSSAKSLFFDWTEEDERGRRIVDIHGKILVILESKGMKDLLDTIKPLVSHDSYEVEYRTSHDAPDGRKTTTYVIRGFPVVVDLDIDPNRAPEQETRAFLMSPSLSKEKTEEALELVCRQAVDPMLYGGDDPNVVLVRKALSSLRSYSVINPFLERIEGLFPKQSMAEARHLRRLNSVISARTILYQYQRFKLTFRDGKECLLATAEDNAEGMKAVRHLLRATVSGIPDQTLQFWNEYVSMKEGRWFTIGDVRDDAKGDANYNTRHKVKKQLDFLRNKGLLIRRNPAQNGLPYTYEVNLESDFKVFLGSFEGVFKVEEMEISHRFLDTLKGIEKITCGSKELWKRKSSIGAFSEEDFKVVRSLCLDHLETTPKRPLDDSQNTLKQYDKDGWLKPYETEEYDEWLRNRSPLPDEPDEFDLFKSTKKAVEVSR